MIVGRDGSCKGNLGLARSIGIGYNLSSENVAGGGICTRKSCGGQQVPNLPRLLISPRQPRSRRAPGWAPDQGSLTTQGRLDPRIITEEVRLLGPQAREGLGFFCRGQVRRRWGMKKRGVVRVGWIPWVLRSRDKNHIGPWIGWICSSEVACRKMISHERKYNGGLPKEILFAPIYAVAPRREEKS